MTYYFFGIYYFDEQISGVPRSTLNYKVNMLETKYLSFKKKT